MEKLSDKLDDLDPSSGENLGKFVGSLLKSIDKALKDLDNKKIRQLLKPIAELFYGLQAIVNTNIFKMKISLNPLKGYLLGRQIGQFLHAIMKRIREDHVDESVKYIGEILKPMAEFADPKSKFSYWKLRRVLSNRNARQISSFFKTLMEGLPDKK